MPNKMHHQVESFQKAIAFALEAVSGVADESLKVVAFQVILQRLLTFDDAKLIEEKTLREKPHPYQATAKEKDKRPKGPKGRVEELIKEGFFSQKRTLADIRKELERHTWYHRVEDLGPTLVRIVQEKKLRRIKEPEKEGGKLAWRYSNW